MRNTAITLWTVLYIVIVIATSASAVAVNVNVMNIQQNKRQLAELTIVTRTIKDKETVLYQYHECSLPWMAPQADRMTATATDRDREKLLLNPNLTVTETSHNLLVTHYRLQYNSLVRLKGEQSEEPLGIM